MPAKTKLARGLRALPKAEPNEKPNEKQIERFISAGDRPRQPGRGTSLRTRRAVGGTRVTIYIPDELLQRLQTVAFQHRRSVSDVTSEAIERHLPALEGPDRKASGAK